MICTSVADFEDKSRVLLPTLEKLNKSNIKLKLALSGDSEKIKKINVKHNLKAKPINSSARLFMADKKEVLFMVTPENAEEEIGVWLDTPFFTESLSSIVETSLRAEKAEGN